jgi:hypothetical protein
VAAREPDAQLGVTGGRRRRPLRVLLVAPFERGLDHGGSQRASAMAERLEERGAAVDWRSVSPRTTSWHRKLGAAVALRPALVGLHPPAPPTPHARFDAAVAAHSYLAPQLSALPPAVARVVDFHNLEWRHLSDMAASERAIRRPYLRAQVLLMRGFERRAIRANALSVFGSEEELRWARRVAPGGDLLLVPSVLPRRAELEALALGDRAAPPPEPHLTYVGTLRFPPNLRGLTRFLREAWPLVRREAPGVKLTIAGDCAAGHRAELNAFAGVEALGFVEDIRPLLERSSAAIMPVDGWAGTSLRTLYYALAGIWVIGSPAAFRGVPFAVGSAVESPRQWAQTVREAMDGAPGREARLARARSAAIARQRDPGPWDDLFEMIGRAVDGAAQPVWTLRPRHAVGR